MCECDSLPDDCGPFRSEYKLTMEISGARWHAFLTAACERERSAVYRVRAIDVGKSEHEPPEPNRLTRTHVATNAKVWSHELPTPGRV